MVRLACAGLTSLALSRVVAAQWTPPEGCSDGWGANQCCCMLCDPTGMEHSTFSVQLTETCKASGGQCKSATMSAYNRKGRGQRADERHFAKPPAGEPHQAHLIGGYPDEVTVVFMTDGPAKSEVSVRLGGGHPADVHQGSSETYSFEIMPGGWNGYPDKAGPHPGPAFKDCDGGFTAYYNTTCMYTSAMVHTVRIQNLLPGTAYEYLPAGSSRWRPFRTPPARGSPIKFGIVADLGQTMDSLTTMRHMKRSLNSGAIDSIILPGDLSYADGFPQAWDSFGHLSEFLFETVPTAFNVGNHEYGSGGENFANFMPRYGWSARDRSSSSSPLWYSFDAGLAHVVMLCSYCDTFEGGWQHQWLQQDLASVDRSTTPWVVAAWHTPWYTSGHSHNMQEAHEMRDAMEDLLYDAKVDFVFTGHLHAYERTDRIYQNKTRCDGAVYITIGDGGNHEGPACPWEQWDFEWSVKKEFSFGHGVLDFVNHTHAQWSWHRNQDADDVVADEAWFMPAASGCGAGLVV